MLCYLQSDRRVSGFVAMPMPSAIRRLNQRARESTRRPVVIAKE